MDSSKYTEERVVIELTDQGYPYFASDSKLSIEVRVAADDSEVEIAGSAESLRRLGEILIGLSRCKDYHIHLDGSSESVIAVTPVSTNLVITNSDDLPVVDSRTSDPPDWARG